MRGAVRVVLVCATACVLPGAASAQAQGEAGRGYVGAAIGALLTASTSSAPLTLPAYGESARLEMQASWPADATVEVDGGVRLWRDFGVALTVMRGRRDGDSTLSGPIPHPYFFNQPRTLDASGGTLTRTETALHLGLMWRRRLTRRLAVAAVVGPSMVAVSQDVIDGVVWSETYPYTSVQLSRATITRRDRSTAGVHAGGDLVVRLARHLGVTGGVRYCHAGVVLESAPGQQIKADVGGFVVRGGARWLF
jgi:hypothetical protein